MKPTLTLLLVFFALQTFGQDKITTAELLGSWKQTGYEIDDTFYPYGRYHEVVSYYSNGSCEWYNVQTDTIVFKGKWNINTSDNSEPVLEVIDCFKIPQQANWNIGNRSNVISKVAEDKLILLGYEGELQLKLIYVRVKNVEQQYPNEEKSSNSTPVKNYDDRDIENCDAYLLNNIKSKKAHKVHAGNQVDFNMNCKDSLIENEHYSFDLSGTITAITDSTIDIWVGYEYKSWGNESSEHTAMNDLDLFDGKPVIRTYKYTDISSLDYKNPLKTTLFSIGGTMVYVGSISALFVAPLVSLNYRTGEFNSERYLKVAAYSLGTVGMGIPIMITGKSRHYEISEEKSKNFWTFKGSKP